MAFDAGAVTGRAILDDSQWTNGAKNVEGTTKGMTGSVFKAQVAFAAFSKILSATVNTIKNSVNIAKDFGEENSKLGTVFRNVGKDATVMRKELVNSYGLSRMAATQLLASTGDLLTGFGFTQQSALDLSGEVQKLAVDLASFTNFSGGASGASAALTKALLGERESVKALGISILEADVQAKVLELTQQGLTFETERQAKAYATLKIAQEQSKNAIGDFARTSDQLANRQRQLSSVTQDLQVQIGSLFTPILNDFTKAALDSAKGLRDFLDSTEGAELLSNIFAGIKSSIEVLKTVFNTFSADVGGTVTETINSITDNFKDLFGGINNNISAFDILAGAIKLVGIGINVIIKVNGILINGWIDLVKVVKEAILVLGNFWKAVKGEQTWKEALSSVKNIGTAYVDVFKNAYDGTKDLITDTINEFQLLPEGTQEASNKMNAIWADSFSKNKKIMQASLQEQDQILTEEVTTTAEKVPTIWEQAMKKWEDSTKQSFAKAQTKFEQFAKIFNYIVSAAQDAFNKISSIINDSMQNDLDTLIAKNEAEMEEFDKKAEAKLEAINTQYDSEEEALQTQLDNGVIIQAEYDEAFAELEKQRAAATYNTEQELERKKEELRKKQLDKENAQEKKIFESEKANKIAEVWIETALGIVAAWTGAFQSLGGIPIVGPALAIAMAAVMSGILLGTAIAETVVISQQQFIPKKARGGMASGLTEINEGGRGEIVNLPDNSLVIPNDISRQIASNVGGGGNVINVSFAGATISDNMSLSKVADYVIKRMGQQLRTV